MMASVMQAAEKLDLKSITSGAFSASYVTGINPIEGTDLYASISSDGKQVVSYSSIPVRTGESCIYRNLLNPEVRKPLPNPGAKIIVVH